MNEGNASTPQAMRAVLAAVALLTVAAIVLAWWLTIDLAPAHSAYRRPLIAQQVVPPAIIPAVEPIEYAALSNDEARTINAAVPFSTDRNPAARPFVLREPALDRARAQDCLAVAMLYEAGSADPEGQRAVAQVIVNRLRHPAFPKTICGVVFQGQERRTGCQFTFTCDGALGGLPRAEAWEDARARATTVLDGAVYARVGHSTHYHTDWVVPYWSASLDKVTNVRTHLFFRWSGWWGTPGAFRGGHVGPEPRVAKLAHLSPPHRLEGAEAALPTELDLAGLSLAPVLDDGAGSLVLLVDPTLSSSDYPAFAKSICGARPYCKLFAWSDKALLPAALPVSDAQAGTMTFSYLRDSARGFEKSLWNCAQHPRTMPGDCMKSRMLSVPARPSNAPTAQRFRIQAMPVRPARPDQVPELRVRRAVPVPVPDPATNQAQPAR